MVDGSPSARDDKAPSSGARLPGEHRGEWPRPGERIGKFVAGEVLGRGGMGVVISAHDPELDRDVAVKLVAAADGAGGATHRDRLIREARAMARLRHPNVVSVYEVGEHRGQVYIAMEKIEGETLGSAAGRLRGDHADWRSVLRLFADAGRGLAAAHAAGLVHRDFKPENALVDRDGRVYVTDFGIVHAADDPGSPATASAIYMEPLTLPDEIMGTPAYLAPERYAGRTDARADQFAFCVALYHALYGALPFSGKRYTDYLAQIRRGAVRPPPVDSPVPEWVYRAIARGLSPEPDERYRSMDELIADLDMDPAKPRHTGQRERAIVLFAIVLFNLVWIAMVLRLHPQMTFPIHYGVDGAFLVIVLVVGSRMPRTRFNRHIYGGTIIVALSVLALVAGGQLLGLSATEVAVLHMLVGAIAFAMGSLFVDSRLWPGVAGYLIAFFAGAAWPPRVLIPVLLAHTAAGVVLALVLAGRRAASPLSG